MKYRVRQAFNYAHDGVRGVRLAVGDVCEIREELANSLYQAGLIEEVKARPGAPDNKAIDAAPENKARKRR